MIRTLTLAAGLALAAAPATAQAVTGAQSAPSAQDLREAYFALEDEYDEAYAAWRADYTEKVNAYREAREADPTATFERPDPIEPEFIGRFQRLADAGSGDAQVWVIQNYLHTGLSGDEARADKRSRVLAALAADVRPEGLQNLARALGFEAMGRNAHLTQEESHALLDLMAASCSDREAAATAAYYKASSLDDRRASRAERQAAMDAFKEVAARFPDTDMGARAGGNAFAFENLNIGQTAPEIVGQDVDGNPMRLSDFAGKVVVIDFWGFW